MQALQAAFQVFDIHRFIWHSTFHLGCVVLKNKAHVSTPLLSKMHFREQYVEFTIGSTISVIFEATFWSKEDIGIHDSPVAFAHLDSRSGFLRRLCKFHALVTSALSAAVWSLERTEAFRTIPLCVHMWKEICVYTCSEYLHSVALVAIGPLNLPPSVQTTTRGAVIPPQLIG